ncbi:location of vulva defective 1-like isoform X2 [Latimeria chalumnae]|uniref:location of vulva defective 1-like isoform X2 n=1 Tax=Latimeria chalumnae TaxID=7897 RepID=UPI0003C13E54|nr:PREDICTED: location of vulva defective 1-like isoform X2 [Latimeria chalumnae]|eukprot:XP_005988522.1 PREDICTED: location of vulva defective 1-like isoform X2 [Latimeria chalumnae]
MSLKVQFMFYISIVCTLQISVVAPKKHTDLINNTTQDTNAGFIQSINTLSPKVLETSLTKENETSPTTLVLKTSVDRNLSSTAVAMTTSTTRQPSFAAKLTIAKTSTQEPITTSAGTNNIISSHVITSSAGPLFNTSTPEATGTTESALATTSSEKNSFTTKIDTTVVSTLYAGSLHSSNTTQISGGRFHLRYSEAILTIIFSSILGVAVLVVVMYIVSKCKRRRAQYTHRPLYNIPFEDTDRYSAPDDTLVISGGLYDAPRIYNPNMTVLEEDDFPSEPQPFGSRPAHFRLEFLQEESERDPTFGSRTFKTFHSPTEEP